MNNDSRIVLYDGKDGETEIAIRVSAEECIQVLGGMAMCDLCGNFDDTLFLCPELGFKALCGKCFRQHRRTVKWYTEDTHTVFNTLILMVKNYNLNWTENDFKNIDEYFSSKGWFSTHIKTFL